MQDVQARNHSESVLYWTRRLDEATRHIEMSTARVIPLRDRCRRHEALANLRALAGRREVQQ